MKLIRFHFCLLLLSRSFADDSVLKHGPPEPELDDEDLAGESNSTQLHPASDQEGLCVDMVGQGWILMPIHDSLGGSDCSFDRKCRSIECCRVMWSNVSSRLMEGWTRMR